MTSMLVVVAVSKGCEYIGGTCCSRVSIADGVLEMTVVGGVCGVRCG